MRKKPNKKKPIQASTLIEKLADSLEIPKETICQESFITLLGNREINVENFGNISKYSEEMICLKTQSGLLVIEGSALVAKTMDSEAIRIQGTIKNIGFK